MQIPCLNAQFLTSHPIELFQNLQILLFDPSEFFSEVSALKLIRRLNSFSGILRGSAVLLLPLPLPVP